MFLSDLCSVYSAGAYEQDINYDDCYNLYLLTFYGCDQFVIENVAHIWYSRSMFLITAQSHLILHLEAHFLAYRKLTSVARPAHLRSCTVIHSRAASALDASSGNLSFTLQLRSDHTILAYSKPLRLSKAGADHATRRLHPRAAARLSISLQF